ncbi:unnamed protein product [Lota lota]
MGRRMGLLMKGKKLWRRETRGPQVSAVQPNRTGKKTLNTKVRGTHRQGPGRASESTSDPPMRSPAPRPTAATFQGSTPITPATYILKMGPKKAQGPKAHAKKPMKKAGEAARAPKAARGAGSANEASAQDLAPPGDPLQPLVSSFGKSSLSNSASSQSVAPSSSTTMTSAPTSSTRTRSLF